MARPCLNSTTDTVQIQKLKLLCLNAEGSNRVGPPCLKGLFTSSLEVRDQTDATTQNSKGFDFCVLITMSLFTFSGDTNKQAFLAFLVFIKTEASEYVLSSEQFLENVCLHRVFDRRVNMYWNNFLHGNHNKCITKFLF